jgi:hypothetical protein
VGASSAGSDGTAELGSGARASLLLEPRDELLNGELLGKLIRRASSASSRGLGRGRGSGGGGLSGSGGGSRGRRSRGSRRRRGGGSRRLGRGGGSRGRTRAGAGAHCEVNAGLVGLVDLGGVPVPLDDAGALLGALGTDVGHGDVEAGPVGVLVHGGGGEGVLVPADEGLADDLVGLGVDNGDVGNTIVRGMDLNLHGDDLASGVGEDLAGIGEGDALALPHLAVGVVAVEVLEGTLDIAILVGVLGVVDLITAGGLEAITGQTGSGRGDEAVGGDGGGKASNGKGGGVGLHVEVFLVD